MQSQAPPETNTAAAPAATTAAITEPSVQSIPPPVVQQQNEPANPAATAVARQLAEQQATIDLLQEEKRQSLDLAAKATLSERRFAEQNKALQDNVIEQHETAWEKHKADYASVWESGFKETHPKEDPKALIEEYHRSFISPNPADRMMGVALVTASRATSAGFAARETELKQLNMAEQEELRKQAADAIALTKATSEAATDVFRKRAIGQLEMNLQEGLPQQGAVSNETVHQQPMTQQQKIQQLTSSENITAEFMAAMARQVEAANEQNKLLEPLSINRSNPPPIMIKPIGTSAAVPASMANIQSGSVVPHSAPTIAPAPEALVHVGASSDFGGGGEAKRARAEYAIEPPPAHMRNALTDDSLQFRRMLAGDAF